MNHPSALNNGNIFLTTYLAIIRLTSACVIGFCCRAEKSSFRCLDDFAPCPSLLVDDELSSVVEVLVFLATSFVDECVVVRCFIKLELLTTDVDKVFALGPGMYTSHPRFCPWPQWIGSSAYIATLKMPNFQQIDPDSPFLLLHRMFAVCVWRACPGLYV